MEINNLGKPPPISAMRIYQKRLKKICESILALGDNPYMGTEPGYRVLKRQGYKVLILEKDLIFYKGVSQHVGRYII